MRDLDRICRRSNAVHVPIKLENRLHILHASFSLCSAEYFQVEGAPWRRIRDYELALLGIQAEPEGKIRESLDEHLSTNGWVASLIPLGAGAQSEFAISLDWLASVGCPRDE